MIWSPGERDDEMPDLGRSGPRPMVTVYCSKPWWDSTRLCGSSSLGRWRVEGESMSASSLVTWTSVVFHEVKGFETEMGAAEGWKERSCWRLRKMSRPARR